MFRSNIPVPSSGSKVQTEQENGVNFQRTLSPTYTGFLHGLRFDSEDGDDLFLRIIGLALKYITL
jgi:hypothetical protein